MKPKTKSELLECICPSVEIRKYWEAVNYELTVLQMAILVVNSITLAFNHTQQLEIINKLIEIADDTETKDTLKCFIDQAQKTIAAFKQESPNTVFEVMSIDDTVSYMLHESVSEGLGSNYETALRIKNNCGENVVAINKREIYNGNDYNGEDGTIGRITFADNGEISSVYSAEIEGSYMEKIPNLYVALPHPFHKGDVVKNIVTGEWGVVGSGPITGEDFNAYESKLKWKKGYEPLIVVEHLSEDGEFYHKHYDPLVLETVPQEDSNKYRLFECAGLVLQGKSPLYCLDYSKKIYMSELENLRTK